MNRLLFVVLIATAGCLGPRSDPSAFFMLNATVTPQQASRTTAVLGLGPITVPSYLDRPQIVVRMSENEVALAEHDRWAEPLGENLARSLEENLSALLPEASFVAYPWYASNAPRYAISVEVRRFEADAAGGVELDATWQITEGDALVGSRSTRARDSATAGDRAAMVAALSRTVGQLSREIAAGIQRIEGR